MPSIFWAEVFLNPSDDIWVDQVLGVIRQVDYLSHEWYEPVIWCSWQYVRKERAQYPLNAARLENSLWRTWAKARYKLKTIPLETLNWYFCLSRKDFP
jgi:hypothetical protein